MSNTRARRAQQNKEVPQRYISKHTNSTLCHMWSFCTSRYMLAIYGLLLGVHSHLNLEGPGLAGVSTEKFVRWMCTRGRLSCFVSLSSLLSPQIARSPFSRPKACGASVRLSKGEAHLLVRASNASFFGGSLCVSIC